MTIGSQPSRNSQSHMKIAFLIESSALSGGNYVVFQHALHASEAGHEVTIITMVRGTPYRDVWHPAIPKLRFIHIDEAALESHDIAFATYWVTALELHRIPSQRYAYFVQSIESRFYPEEARARRAFIEAIYAWNLPGITEATWIKGYLETHHGSRYHLVRNGIRKDLYQTEGPRVADRNGRHLRVLIEGAFGSIKNTARALATARRAGNNDVWLLTTSDIPWYPGVQRLFRRMPVGQIPPIYRSCDVILKLSLVEGMFGPPLEMFHCGGTAVVYDVSGHDEYIVHEKNALVVPMHDEEAVVRSLRRLSDEPGLLETLKHGALESALAWPSWQTSSAEFLRAIEALCAAEAFTRERLIAELEHLRTSFSEEVVGISPATANATPAAAWSASVVSLRKTVRRYRKYFNHIADSYR